MNQISDIVSGAAQQNDRYLFMLLLAICFAAIYWAGKWLVGRLEKQTELLEGLFREANTGRENVAKIVAENTVQSRECTHQMRENTEFLRAVQNRK